MALPPRRTEERTQRDAVNIARSISFNSLVLSAFLVIYTPLIHDTPMAIDPEIAAPMMDRGLKSRLHKIR